MGCIVRPTLTSLDQFKPPPLLQYSLLFEPLPPLIHYPQRLFPFTFHKLRETLNQPHLKLLWKAIIWREQ